MYSEWSYTFDPLYLWFFTLQGVGRSDACPWLNHTKHSSAFSVSFSQVWLSAWLLGQWSWPTGLVVLSWISSCHMMAASQVSWLMMKKATPMRWSESSPWRRQHDSRSAVGHVSLSAASRIRSLRHPFWQPWSLWWALWNDEFRGGWRMFRVSFRAHYNQVTA